MSTVYQIITMCYAYACVSVNRMGTAEYVINSKTDPSPSYLDNKARKCMMHQPINTRWFFFFIIIFEKECFCWVMLYLHKCSECTKFQSCIWFVQQHHSSIGNINAARIRQNENNYSLLLYFLSPQLTKTYETASHCCMYSFFYVLLIFFFFFFSYRQSFLFLFFVYILQLFIVETEIYNSMQSVKTNNF